MCLRSYNKAVHHYSEKFDVTTVPGLDNILAQLMMMLATAGSDEDLGVLVAWGTGSEIRISGSLEVVGNKMILSMCASKRHNDESSS